MLPLVYRDDVIDGLLAAAERAEATGKVVNLVDPTPVEQNEYLRQARPALGNKPVWRVPGIYPDDGSDRDRIAWARAQAKRSAVKVPDSFAQTALPFRCFRSGPMA